MRANMRSRPGFMQCRSGVAAVEFAGIAMAVLMVIAFLAEASVQLVTDALLQYGVREAARFGITGEAYPPSLSNNPPASRQAAIAAIITTLGGGLINQAHLTITLTSYANFDQVGGTGGVAGPGGPNAVVVYNVSYTQPYLTSLAATVMGNSFLTHSVVTVVQNEPFPSS